MYLYNTLYWNSGDHKCHLCHTQVCWLYHGKWKHSDLCLKKKKLMLWKECSKSGCLEIFSLRKMFDRILNPFVKNICLIPYNCWRINDWLQLRWKFINWISIRSWHNFVNNFLSSFGSIKLCEDSFFQL